MLDIYTEGGFYLNENKLGKLKGKLVEKQKTYAQCAAALGISVTSFSNKANGNYKFNIDEVRALIKLLDLSEDEQLDVFLT